ncbi:ABC transporter permease subunit [Virgisporangium ochraceum]|uniref:ABC transporter n=1 Tax=Virgisporangium ochraceum TaxID=65505 RepID=A0A8J4A5C6_9ACTN|nr:ABC transporter permease [Virgisporangium ochraceum]GIJ75198.1 ABC transporter [Virgisporangium ochraceum]
MIAAELIKLRSLRATPVTLALAVVVCAGLAYVLGLSAHGIMSEGTERQRDWYDPVFYTFYAVMLGQFGLVVFGVFAAGGEYPSGTIRASLLAMPRRGRFYASKILATGLLAALSAAAAVPATYLASRAGMGGMGSYGAGLDAPGMRAAFVGACLYLPLMCLFALGVATMVRSSAIALGVLMPVLFLGSQGLGNAPKVGTVLQFLPDQAGATIFHLGGRPTDPDYMRDFGPWTGLAILAAWTALSLLGGYLTLRRRDA